MSHSKSTVTSEPLDTKIFYARRYIGLNIIAGVLLILVGLIALLSTGASGSPVGIGILFIILTIVRYHMGYVIIGKDYLAIKLAPARARVSILFDEITSIIQTDKKITLVYTINGQPNATEKRININLKVMDKNELANMQQALYKQLASKISQQ